MHPPAHICKSLARIHPHLRLAWQGRPARYTDPVTGELEINPGWFSLIYLAPRPNVGRDDELNIYQSVWNRELVIDADSGNPQWIRLDRGPIFNKYGGTRPEYDPGTRCPITIARLAAPYEHPDGSKIKSPYDVFSGKFLNAVRNWMIPFKERHRKAAEKVANHLITTGADMGRAAYDRIKFEARKPDQTNDRTTPYKMHKKQIARQDKWNNVIDDQIRARYGLK